MKGVICRDSIIVYYFEEGNTDPYPTEVLVDIPEPLYAKMQRVIGDYMDIQDELGKLYKNED